MKKKVVLSFVIAAVQGVKEGYVPLKTRNPAQAFSMPK